MTSFMTLLKLPWYSGVTRTTPVAARTVSCNILVAAECGSVPGNGRFKAAGSTTSTDTFGCFLSSSTTYADAMPV